MPQTVIYKDVVTSENFVLEELTFPLGYISVEDSAGDSSKQLVQLILIIWYGHSKWNGKHPHLQCLYIAG